MNMENTSATKVVLKVGNLIDSVNANIQKNKLIFIRNQKIFAILDMDDHSIGLINNEDLVVDLSQDYVMPGLIDAHIHFFGVPSIKLDELVTMPESFRSLRAAKEASEMLKAGITAARCCGSSISPSLKKAIDAGLIEGPRLVVAGQFVCASNGTWDHIKIPIETMREIGMIADGEVQLRQKVRERLREGAGLIKVGLSIGAVGDEYHAWGDHPDKGVTSYTIEEIKALTDEAHKNRIKVSAHCIGDESVINAIKGGIDTIEHGYPLTPKTREIVAEKKIIVTTTATQLYCHNESAEKYSYSEGEKRLFKLHEETMRDNFILGLKAGIKYTLGSDLIGPPTHSQTLFPKEFEIAVDWGMSNMDAIISGTRISAEALGLERDIGTLEIGKFADIIAMKENPLQDITALKRINFVMKSGYVVRDNSKIQN